MTQNVWIQNWYSGEGSSAESFCISGNSSGFWGMGLGWSEMFVIRPITRWKYRTVVPGDFGNTIFCLFPFLKSILFSEHTFNGQHSLISINLGHNEIREIHPKAFSNISQLLYVYLYNNQLSYIHPKTFGTLEKLHLERNRFQTFARNTFVQPIIYIFLEGKLYYS